VLKRPGYVAAQWQELVPHLEAGLLTPPIGLSVPLTDAAKALEAIDNREAVGKVVLVP
jgi:NADPH2:quinone reductase